MKKIIFIFIISCITIFCVNAQGYKQGYKNIQKAEKFVNLGNFEKAREYLAKAKKCSYGFCGNAWSSAYGGIYLLQAKIYFKEEEYLKSLAVLDSINTAPPERSCIESDSLRVQILFTLYGKEKIKNLIYEAANETVSTKSLYKKICLSLTAINYSFCFHYDELNLLESSGDKVVMKPEIQIMELLKKEKVYTFLEQE